MLSHDHQELVLHDYFKGEKRAALSSPDGAHLTGDIVNALTGHTEYARRPTAASPPAICDRPCHQTRRHRDRDTQRRFDHPEPGRQRRKRRRRPVRLRSRHSASPSSTARCSVCRRTRRWCSTKWSTTPTGRAIPSLISLVAGTISFVAGGDRQARRHEDRYAGRHHGHPRHRGAGRDRLQRSRPGRRARRENSRCWSSRTAPPGSYILFDKNTLTPIAEVNKAGQQIKHQQRRRQHHHVAAVAGSAKADQRRFHAEILRPKSPNAPAFHRYAHSAGAGADHPGERHERDPDRSVREHDRQFVVFKVGGDNQRPAARRRPADRRDPRRDRPCCQCLRYYRTRQQDRR